MTAFYKEDRFKKTKIGEMPEDWEVARFRDIVREAKSGFASGRRDPNGILQLRMDNIDTEGHIRKEAGVKVPVPQDFENYLLQPGDVLFNNTNSVDMIGKTAIFQGEFSRCVYSNHLTRIRGDARKVIAPWILYLLMRKWRLGFFKSICHRHVHQAGINNEDLLNLDIPIAPLAEQQGIAGVLGVVDLAVSKTGEVIAKTERLKKGLMQELLTKGIGHKEYKQTPIGTIPKEWEVARISSIGNTSTGKTPSTQNDEYWNGEIPFITPADIKELKYVYETERHVTPKGADQSNILPKDTVLSVCIGSTIGKVALTYNESVTNQQINAIICNKETAEPHYVYYTLLFRAHLLKSFSGVAAVPIVKKSLFEQFKIPIPSISEQRKIAEILSSVDSKLELERTEKARLERIKIGLMDLLLTGKIRVKVD